MNISKTAIPGILLMIVGCAFPLEDDGSGAGSSSSSESSTGSASATGASASSGPVSATTSADSGSDAGTGTSTDTGMLFIEGTSGCGAGPDGSVWHCTFECDVNEPNDCPEDEKCMPWANDGGNAWNATRCSPIDPAAVPPGGPCTVEGAAVSGFDDCALGSMCWGVDPDTLMGTCESFCDSLDESACAAPEQCVDLNEDNFNLCLSPCNPLDADPCPTDEECRLVGEAGPYCLPAQGGDVQGNSGSCGDSSCGVEALCIGPAEISACDAECCTPWCDLGDAGADAACAATNPALACVPLYEPGTAPAGLELLGLCIEPA